MRSDAELFLQSSDHLLILLVFQEYRIGIGDCEAAAKLKTAFVLGNDVEMKMRVCVAEGTEVNLGASPELLDSAGCSSQICGEISSFLIGALTELFLVCLKSKCAAALVCLILEEIQNACL